MPPRIQVQDPLKNRAPSPTPTVRPQSISPWVSPAPRTNKLLDLASALSGINPVLRQIAGRKRQEAFDIGANNAEKLAAADKMGNLNEEVKKLGKGVKGFVPFAIRGASERAGANHALSLEAQFNGRLTEASLADGRTDPLAIVEEIRQQALEDLPFQQDPNSQRSFLDSFDQVARRFVSAAESKFQKNHEEFQDTSRMQSLSNLVDIRLEADNTNEESLAVSDIVKAITSNEVGIGLYRPELPKASQIERISKDSAFILQTLINQGEFEDAATIREELGGVKIAGLTKGILEKNVIFQNLIGKIDQQLANNVPDDLSKANRQAANESVEANRKGAEAAFEFTGGEPLPRKDVQTLLDKFNLSNPSTTQQLAFKQGLLAATRKEDDAQSEATINRLLNNISTEGIAEAEETLRVFKDHNKFLPATLLQFEDQLKSNKLLSDFYTSKSLVTVKEALYPVRDPAFGIEPNFDSGPEFDQFSVADKEEHQKSTQEFFNNLMQTKLRAIGDVQEASNQFSRIQDDAIQATQKYADTITANIIKRNAVSKEKGVVNTLALQNKIVFDGLNTFLEKFQIGSDRSVERLQKLADDSKINTGRAKTDDSLKKANKAAKDYTTLKEFVPDEIIKKVTVEGVEFDPSLIDYKRVKVFASLDILKKAFNKGDPTKTFDAVINAIDPNDEVSEEEFYRSQLFLFSRYGDPVGQIE